MTYMKKIEQKLINFSVDKVVPFSDARVENISTGTLRKVLHRLHNKGTITIVERGYFKKEKSFSELLFVYGSLKKGFDNHDLLKKYTLRLGKAETVNSFGMFEDTFGNYPYLTDTRRNVIHGEIYQIRRKELMDKLDVFEGSPEYYERRKIKVKSHHGIQKAFVYIQPNTAVPKGQKSLENWENNVEQKVEKLHNYLEKMIEA